jgi:predicted nucleotidyltransferase component of viral defense system
MDSIVDYEKLYDLQDKVLKTIFDTEQLFYLTGGTCLSRFYQEKRYSDDLDFFTNASPRYSFALRNIKIALQKEFTLTVEVESKDFTRFRIDGLLQLDFVNDISSRYGEVIVTQNKFLIDNIENILSNKLTAVIGRDNPKDIFDIYLISKLYKIDWTDILKSAHEKASFSNEELIIRLKSFPKKLLHEINIIDKKILDNFEDEFKNVIKNIENVSLN